jgi:sigma-B regulation protein RsbU (phosphoserine phosphatase)
VSPWPGGDYYDFLLLPDGRLVFLIADASGHGGPSAVLVAMARVVIHSCPLSSGAERVPFCPFRQPLVHPPSVTLGHLNRVLAENSLEEQFMTAFLGILDPVKGQLGYSNAGHPPPRWWRASRRSVEALPDVAGVVLGVDPHASYLNAYVGIEPGDIVVGYSDGLTEAQGKDGGCFGVERLDQAIREFASDGAEELKAGILARLNQFMNGRQPHDDVTLLILEREVNHA